MSGAGKTAVGYTFADTNTVPRRVATKRVHGANTGLTRTATAARRPGKTSLASPTIAVAGTIGAVFPRVADFVSAAGTTILGTGGTLFAKVTNPVSTTGAAVYKAVLAGLANGTLPIPTAFGDTGTCKLTNISDTCIDRAQIVAVVAVFVGKTTIEFHRTRDTNPVATFIAGGAGVSIITRDRVVGLFADSATQAGVGGAGVVVITIGRGRTTARRTRGEILADVVFAHIVGANVVAIITICVFITAVGDRIAGLTHRVFAGFPFAASVVVIAWVVIGRIGTSHVRVTNIVGTEVAIIT